MTKTIDQKIESIIEEMKNLGLEAFEAKQKATNPDFYQSALNELPDFIKLRSTNCESSK